MTPSAGVALTAVLALGLGALSARAAWADLDADVKRWRSDIGRIGEDPRSPNEQYCLGLSYQFALHPIPHLRRTAPRLALPPENAPRPAPHRR